MDLRIFLQEIEEIRKLSFIQTLPVHSGIYEDVDIEVLASVG